MKPSDGQAVLILGAGGFIGRHLAERLAERGRAVLAATRQPQSFANPCISNVVAPFDSAAQFQRLLSNVDSVVHAASISTPSSSAAYPQLDGNLRATLALIEAMQVAAPPRLVYLSSGGTVYGDSFAPAREDADIRPRSYHGAGKVAAEAFVNAWTEQYAGVAVVLRPSNVYGPGQLSRPGFGVVATAMACARAGKPFTIWGDGTSIRDYLFVDDLMDLCEAALERPLPIGRHLFNAAHGRGVTLNTLLDTIDRTTGRPLIRNHLPTRGVDVHSITLNASAALKQLGWRSCTPLDAGLHRTWQWAQRQP